MIGVILLFVGSLLLVNGMGGLDRVEPKSMAVMNFMVGGLGLVASLLQLSRADSSADFFAVAALLLFTFTYLYIAICIWLDLDLRGFGWFGFFITFFPAILGVFIFKSALIPDIISIDTDRESLHLT